MIKLTDVENIAKYVFGCARSKRVVFLFMDEVLEDKEQRNLLLYLSSYAM